MKQIPKFDKARGRSESLAPLGTSGKTTKNSAEMEQSEPKVSVAHIEQAKSSLGLNSTGDRKGLLKAQGDPACQLKKTKGHGQTKQQSGPSDKGKITKGTPTDRKRGKPEGEPELEGELLLSFQSNSMHVCSTSVWAFDHAYSVKVCASLGRTQLETRLQGIFQKQNPLPWYMTEEVRKPEPGQLSTAQAKQSVAGFFLCDEPEHQSAMAALEPPRKKADPKAYTPVFEPVNVLRTKMTADVAVTMITQGGCMHVPCTPDTQVSHVFHHAEQLLACAGQTGHPVIYWKG